MKKSLFVAAIAAVSLVACKKGETVDTAAKEDTAAAKMDTATAKTDTAAAKMDTATAATPAPAPAKADTAKAAK